MIRVYEKKTVSLKATNNGSIGNPAEISTKNPSKSSSSRIYHSFSHFDFEIMRCEINADLCSGFSCWFNFY